MHEIDNWPVWSSKRINQLEWIWEWKQFKKCIKMFNNYRIIQFYNQRVKYYMKWKILCEMYLPKLASNVKILNAIHGCINAIRNTIIFWRYTDSFINDFYQTFEEQLIPTTISSHQKIWKLFKLFSKNHLNIFVRSR
jgi:hypothetical protein